MIIPMLCVTIFVILVVWFLLPRVARLMIHTPTAISIHVCMSLFFFQAEDGIRDYKVTGVQTCALPILIGTTRSASTEQRILTLDRSSPNRCYLQTSSSRTSCTSFLDRWGRWPGCTRRQIGRASCRERV